MCRTYQPPILRQLKGACSELRTLYIKCTLLTYEELCDKFCTPLAFITYYGIIQAILQLWKTILRHGTNNTQPYVNKYKCLEKSMSLPAKVYNHVSNNLNAILRYCQKWEKCQT